MTRPPTPLRSRLARGASRRAIAGISLLGLLATGALMAAPASAAGASTVQAPAAAVTSTVPRPDHVVVVVLENKNRAGVVGTAAAPYLNSLAARGANMTQSFGVTHPSQPNYIALFSGDQHGVTSNDCRDLGGTENLGSQLRAAGLTFTGFSESLPQPGFTGCESGQYE
ncbi:MAG: alkaline phosphatase family protein, partial [Friedmanniella sp.]